MAAPKGKTGKGGPLPHGQDQVDAFIKNMSEGFSENEGKYVRWFRDIVDTYPDGAEKDHLETAGIHAAEGSLLFLGTSRYRAVKEVPGGGDWYVEKVVISVKPTGAQPGPVKKGDPFSISYNETVNDIWKIGGNSAPIDYPHIQKPQIPVLNAKAMSVNELANATATFLGNKHKGPPPKQTVQFSESVMEKHLDDFKDTGGYAPSPQTAVEVVLQESVTGNIRWVEGHTHEAEKTAIYTWTRKSDRVGKAGKSPVYELDLYDDGCLSCTCPAWQYLRKGKVRGCKHCDEIASDAKEKLVMYLKGQPLDDDDPVPYVLTKEPTTVKTPDTGATRVLDWED